MAYSKSFPKSSDKTIYPRWAEISLTEEEERQSEFECREKNNRIMRECLDDARAIVQEKRLLENQTVLSGIARALFDKRASHEIFYKEKKARDKFRTTQKE